MNEMYKILHVEDEPTDAELVKRVLKEKNIKFNILLIFSEVEYIQALDDFCPDIILCDHTLPSFNSFKALKILRAKKLDIPFIVITATMTDDVAMTIVRDGADDYILKDRLKRLPHAVVNVIQKNRFEKERKQFITEGYEKEATSKKLLADLSGKLLLATKAARVGIWEYNIQTGDFICDEVVLALYGTTSRDFDWSYQSWLNFLHPDDAPKVDLKLRHSSIDEFEINFEFRIIRTDNAIRYIEASAIAERDSDDKPWRWVGTNCDITERKKAEQVIQLNILERESLVMELTRSIQDLRQFSYITSHNFRAPLSNLLGLLNFVDYSTLSEANDGILKMFKVSTLQLNKTINDLLKILIIKNEENVDIADNDLDDLLNNVCNSLSADGIGNEFTITKSLLVKSIPFNTPYLHSIFLNLISNAIKYRSPNRPLNIFVSTERKADGEVVIMIKDNGLGIDLVRHHEKIFGLYQRFHSNSDGVGLGLFIVKAQVTAVGGNIMVESEVDKGTTFFITTKQKTSRLCSRLPL